MARKRLLYCSMKLYPSTPRRSAIILLFGRVRLEWLLPAFLFLVSQLVFMAFLGARVDASSATWTGATSTDWNTSTNWSGGSVPTTGADATFGSVVTTRTTVDIAIPTAGVKYITFATGTNAHAFTLSGVGDLTIGNTAGIVNNSGFLQTFSVATLTLSNTIGETFDAGTVAGGSLLFSGSSITVAANALLTVTGSNNTRIDNAISGTGSGLTKTSTGTLTLDGANTYTGATTISAGALQLGNGGTTGSLSTSSGITDNANFTINRSNAVTQGTDFSGGAIGGTGSFTQAGSGTTTLTAANTYTGATTISAGTLQLGNGGTTGSLSTSSTITDNGNFTINRSNAVTQGTDFSGGAIGGTGSFTQAGSGTTTLTAVNTYTGATTVNAGTLLVNGTTASGSAVSVNNSGTTLGGTGTINGTVTVGNGAKLLGGTGSAASGTLTLTNSLTLNTGSIIELALGATPGAHSTITRSGSGLWTFDTHQAFTFINLGVVPGTTYTNIITGLASDPGESNWAITNAGWSGSFSYSGGNISLDVVAVPEPATYLAGILTLGALLLHQRRRWRCLLRRHVTSHL